MAYAGCILPLTARANLPEGFGTRHRAGVGITEETDAVVVVVSEETASISVVMSGEIERDLDPPQLRVILRDVLTGERRELSGASETLRVAEPEPTPAAEPASKETSAPAQARSVG
jgi:diadenylate cyclase